MTDNAAQRDNWTHGMGSRWARNATEMESRFVALRDALLAAAAPQPGEKILEIGYGAGGMTAEIARLVGPEGQVTGGDISTTLKSVAEAATAGLENVTLKLADAQSDDLGSGYDAMISSFGMMFFADPVAGLKNIARALRPGGRMVFLCWTDPPANPWFTLNGKVANALFGPLEKPDPNAPGPFGFQNIDRVKGLMAEAGLTDISAHVQDIDIPNSGTARDVARLGFQMGPTFDLARGDADKAEEVVARLAEEFSVFETPDGIVMPSRTVIYSARVAG